MGNISELEVRLCDDAGNVSHERTPPNAFAPELSYYQQLNFLRARGGHDTYTGEPFPCTGGGTFGHLKVLCTSPVHRAFSARAGALQNAAALLEEAEWYGGTTVRRAVAYTTANAGALLERLWEADPASGWHVHGPPGRYCVHAADGTREFYGDTFESAVRDALLSLTV